MTQFIIKCLFIFLLSLIQNALAVTVMPASTSSSSNILPQGANNANPQIFVSTQVQFKIVLGDSMGHGVVGANPPEWNHLLASCPPGTTFVSGVDPNISLREMSKTAMNTDYAGKQYNYYQCFCAGTLTACPTGVSRRSGWGLDSEVICRANVNAWVSTALVQQTGGAMPILQATPDYTFCTNYASGCTPKPFPSSSNITYVPTNYNHFKYVYFPDCRYTK